MTYVSVILPTFNRAAWLPFAIDSVLKQGYQDFELIVVDDGSQDHTREVLTGYGQTIKWVTQANAGVASARNRGISMAQGDWLAFIDSDDEWHDDFLTILMRYVHSRTDLHMVIADCALIAHRSPHATYFSLNAAQSAFTQAQPASATSSEWRVLERGFEFIVKHPPWQVGSTLMRHQSVLACGLFNSTLKRSEDLDLIARMALRGPLGLLNTPLVDVHRRPDDRWGLSDPSHLLPVHSLWANEQVYAGLVHQSELTAEEQRTIQRVCGQNRRALAHQLALQQQMRQARAWYLRSLWMAPSWAGVAATATALLPGPLHCGVLRWARQWRHRSPIEGTS